MRRYYAANAVLLAGVAATNLAHLLNTSTAAIPLAVFGAALVAFAVWLAFEAGQRLDQ